MKNIFKFFKIFRTIGVIGAGVVGVLAYRKKKDEIQNEKEQRMKMTSYYMLFNKWLKLKEEGRSLEEYFVKNNIRSIAIYGYREFGERLYQELKDTSIEVKYIIDKNMDRIRSEIDIYSPEEELPQVDAIVVTATYYFDEIEDELVELVDYQIISLEDVVL